MAITKTRLKIEINEKINTQVTGVKGDTLSRYLDVSFYDKGLPIDLTDHRVELLARRTETGVVVQRDFAEITDAAAGRCQVELKNSILAETGSYDMQFVIWDSEAAILSTEVFTFIATESIRNDEEVEATNEFGVLVVLFTEIQNALELMKYMTDTFGLPGEMAEAYGVDTFWGMLEHLAKGADVEHALKNYINSTMGTNAETPLDVLLKAGQDAIKAVVDAIKTSVTTGGVPIVRHIQRGTGSVAYNKTSAAVELSGFTNLEKMSVRVYGGRTVVAGDNSKGEGYYPAYFGDVSTTSLTVKCDGDYDETRTNTKAYFSYEVIEFW